MKYLLVSLFVSLFFQINAQESTIISTNTSTSVKIKKDSIVKTIPKIIKTDTFTSHFYTTNNY